MEQNSIKGIPYGLSDYEKYSLITIIIGLGIILFLQITPFLGGLLGALTLSLIHI